MNAASYTLTRYLVSWGCLWLAGRGWSIANLDGATTDALAQMVIGGAGAASMAVIGMLTSTVKWTVARLKARHKTDLVAAAADLPEVHAIHADLNIAGLIPSAKVTAP